MPADRNDGGVVFTPLTLHTSGSTLFPRHVKPSAGEVMRDVVEGSTSMGSSSRGSGESRFVWSLIKICVPFCFECYSHNSL